MKQIFLLLILLTWTGGGIHSRNFGRRLEGPYLRFSDKIVRRIDQTSLPSVSKAKPSHVTTQKDDTGTVQEETSTLGIVEKEKIYISKLSDALDNEIASVMGISSTVEEGAQLTNSSTTKTVASPTMSRIGMEKSVFENMILLSLMKPTRIKPSPTTEEGVESTAEIPTDLSKLGILTKMKEMGTGTTISHPIAGINHNGYLAPMADTFFGYLRPKLVSILDQLGATS